LSTGCYKNTKSSWVSCQIEAKGMKENMKIFDWSIQQGAMAFAPG
jgi:hypothetical protein